MNTLYKICFLVLVSLTGFAQEKDLEWLNKNARPLNLAGDTTLNDLNFLDKALTGNKVLGLGEASHGTHEFYAQKARVIKYSVENLGYRSIGFEFPQSLIGPIDNFIQAGSGDLKLLMQDFKLYATQEIYNLFVWLRQYNLGKSGADRVEVFGFDKAEFAGDPYTRELNMAAEFKSYYDKRPVRSIVWGHNLHIAKDTTFAQFPAFGYHLREAHGEGYYAVGFDTQSGSVNVQEENFKAYTFTSQEQPLTELFAQANAPAFFIQLNDKTSPLYGRRGGITNIYANWTERRTLATKLGIDFDAMIFLRTTIASVPLAK